MTDTIKPEVGKRYVMRNGGVTGVMRRRTDAEDLAYVFQDDKHTWTEGGRYWLPSPSPEDLISEYIEPAPAVDLTKIEKPFGLLDAKTQEALKAWSHGWQYFTINDGWRDWTRPMWENNKAYRAKPAPVERKPREWFANVYADGSISGHANNEAANKLAEIISSERIRVREVIE